MLRRCWGLAVLSFLSVAILPAWGQSTYNKEAVKALSKRIDAHLAKVWEKAKVTPAPKAEDHVFFRRLHLDLGGRLPDLLKIYDFVDPTNDTDKRWIAVDELLEGIDKDGRKVSDWNYPRHFAHVWRSIILTNQTNQQFLFLQPQFESWLRERVEKNITLDRMVNDLLTSQNNPNMGFNQQGSSPQLFFLANENKAENLAGATSRTFLGVKIECAQCHAHPFAKWTKDQFWEFAAFYSVTPQNIRRPGIQQPIQPAIQPGREILIPGTQRVVKAKFLNGQEPKWDTKSSRQTLADWVTAPENPYFARAMADHIWSYLMGVSLLEPIMEPSDDAPVTHPELLNDMAKALMENSFDAKFLIRAIVHTDAYQRSSGGTKLAEKEDYNLFVRMPIRSLSPEQIFENVITVVVRDEGERKSLLSAPNQRFFNPNQPQSARDQFLLKFTNQDRRHEPQTSILQALFLMNGKFLTEKTRANSNEDLRALAKLETSHKDLEGGGYLAGGALSSAAARQSDHARRLRSLYYIVLSRPPRSSEYDRLIPYLDQGGAPVPNDLRDDTQKLGDALSDIYWALLNSSEFLLNH